MARFLIPLLQKLFSYMVAKVMLALGLTFVTYTGYSVGLNWIKESIINNFNSMPASMFQLIMMAGFGHGIGIIFGAYVFNITVSSVDKISFIPGGKK